MTAGTDRTVAIVQARLHHFRVSFYEQLRGFLEHEGIRLLLIHGQPSAEEELKQDHGQLDWAVRVDHRSVSIGNLEFLWQPCLAHLRDSELVIVQQENRFLLNYWLLLQRMRSRKPVAFWGHGVNCQAANPHRLREKWKKLFLKCPDWWFAYTDFTKSILLESGFPRDRITVVQNAVDTTQLRAHDNNITQSELNALRESLGLTARRVGVFCGSLYGLKKLDFLIDAVRRIRQKIEGFELIVIGGGPDAPVVLDAAARHPWLHYVGPRFGRDKVLHLKLGDVFLNPGLVGLAIVDAFVLGLPMFTTDCGTHSPEISYLEPSRNGFMTDVSVDSYATAVVRVLKHPSILDELSDNCRIDAKNYTTENMAANFARGIVGALSAGRRPARRGG